MALCRSDNGTRGKKGEDLFFENRNGSEMKALKTREHDVHPDGFSISCRTHRCGMENKSLCWVESTYRAALVREQRVRGWVDADFILLISGEWVCKKVTIISPLWPCVLKRGIRSWRSFRGRWSAIFYRYPTWQTKTERLTFVIIHKNVPTLKLN